MSGLHLFLNGDRGLAVCRGVVEAGRAIAAVHVPARLAASPALAGPLAALGLTPSGVAEVNDPGFVAALAAARPDILVVAGFSSIFRQPLLATARLGVLNLHAGRLPAYRGGSPLNWQILNGEREAGLSVIRMDGGIDTGPVLAAGSLPIGPDDTIADLHAAANDAFPPLVLAAIARMERGETGDVQDEAAAAYWHQRNDGDGRLFWDRLDAARAHAFVRALTRPYPGAFCFLDGRELRILTTRLEPGPPIRGVPGRIVHLQGRGPFVVCRDRALLLTDWRLAGEERGRLPHGGHLIPARHDDDS